uniref:Uncharacterized protein n=1 Tax=Timema monikensis TaxID=170555 RepID=A0A7R9EHG7_9NEOP|nr:unnamed protein product [Timema monikensis]
MLKVNIFGKSEDEEDEIGSVLSRVKYSDVYTDSYDNDKVSSHGIEMDVEVYLHLCGGIESKPQFLSTPNRDSNHNVHIIGSLVYRESSALDYAATKAGVCEMGNRNVSASPAPPEAPASGEVKKLKACCACPETKRARDEWLAFCCIPGYTGLSGNKLADQAAKVVLVHLPPETLPALIEEWLGDDAWVSQW